MSRFRSKVKSVDDDDDDDDSSACEIEVSSRFYFNLNV